MDWALQNYKSFEYKAGYVGENIDVSKVGAGPIAGEVFTGGPQAPVQTKRFHVVVILDQENQPHVYTAYPVP